MHLISRYAPWPLLTGLLLATPPGCANEGADSKLTSSGAGGGGDEGGGDGSGGGLGGKFNVCQPAALYKSCADDPECTCLQGAPGYTACTVACSDTTECGDDTAPFGIPSCAPLNVGSSDKFCVLICVDDTECPCGLRCTPSGVPSTNVCAVPP